MEPGDGGWTSKAQIIYRQSLILENVSGNARRAGVFLRRSPMKTTRRTL